jgi:hypothetical protein
VTVSSISSSVLLAYLQVKTGQTAANAASGSGASATLQAKAPVAPWSSAATSTSTATSAASTTAAANALVGQILAGGKIVTPTASSLSQTTASPAANSDYENLFALYQGLTSLQSLATAAGASDITSSQLALIQQAFTTGLGQVRSFISGAPFQEFAVSDGTISTSDTTSVGVAQASDTYTTGALVNNSVNAVIPALQGNVAFSMTATNAFGQNPVTVNFNLADMGSTPRTLANVVTYLNGQLAAAGLKTTFADNLMPGTPATTTTSGTTTVVTPATPDQYGLQINGTPNELLSFSAASTAPAVYVAQTSTDPTATSTTSSTTTTTTAAVTLPGASSSTATTAPALTSQVLKLDQPATAGAATTRGFTDNLPAGSTVTATATAPDGSVYVLANVTSTTSGQTIQGTQDAALFKYDSAGNLIWTKTLGAADTIDATALAVSPDGSQVAVAGSITGSTLDPTDTSQAGSTTAQSFVSVYDSAADPLWSQTQDATSANQVNAVTFGANNSVYVAGSTQGRLPGATAEGGQDGYIEGFSATATTDTLAQTTTWTPSVMFTQEFGTSGVDRATGIAVNGGSVYVSSVENGDAVVRRYDVATSTATSTAGATSTSTSATLGAKQDLGALTGGDVTGLAIASDGSVVVAGSTHDASLSAGTITNAYSGNGDAFVADLNANLDPAGAESLAYYNAGGPTTATALTVSGDDAYITGQIAGASIFTPATGYAAAVNLSSGATDWSSTFTGNNGSADPVSIAVSSGGASALDALGLPNGALSVQSQPSQLLTANSSVQAGDSFYVQNGSGLAQKITIQATDTYATLAHEIQVASGNNAAVTTVTIDGQQQLKITPATPNASIRIEAGPAGQDALAPLGLKEGLISNVATSTATASTAATPATPVSNVANHYSITVPASLSLGSTTAIQSASSALSVAIAEVQNIYSDMTTAKASTTPGATGGSVPAYITAQISNYQLALERLTGGSSASGSSTSLTSAGLALSLLSA